MPPFTKHIFVCVHERPAGHPRGCCAGKHGDNIQIKFAGVLAKRGLKATVRANKAGCLDACELGAAVVIYPAGSWYLGVTEDDVEEIVETSIVGDGVVERLAASPGHWERLAQLRKVEAAKGAS